MMTNGTAAAGAAGAHAAIANAIKASGAIIHVESNEFLSLLRRNDSFIIVFTPNLGLNM